MGSKTFLADGSRPQESLDDITNQVYIIGDRHLGLLRQPRTHDENDQSLAPRQPKHLATGDSRHWNGPHSLSGSASA